MGRWQLPGILTDVGDFEGALGQAYQAYKDTDQADHGQHVHSAIEAAITFAKDLVASGIFGAHQVQATISGHANEGFASVAHQTAPDQVQLDIRAVPPEPEIPQGTPGAQQAPAMSEPHQSVVPPPGPGGAAVTQVEDYQAKHQGPRADPGPATGEPVQGEHAEEDDEE